MEWHLALFAFQADHLADHSPTLAPGADSTLGGRPLRAGWLLLPAEKWAATCHACWSSYAVAFARSPLPVCSSHSLLSLFLECRKFLRSPDRFVELLSRAVTRLKRKRKRLLPVARLVSSGDLGYCPVGEKQGRWRQARNPARTQRYCSVCPAG